MAFLLVSRNAALMFVTNAVHTKTTSFPALVVPVLSDELFHKKGFSIANCSVGVNYSSLPVLVFYDFDRG